MFGLDNIQKGKTHAAVVQEWKESLAAATKIASKSAMDGKHQYDKKVRGLELKEGDRVLVRNLSERGGTGKLRSHWQAGVHVVLRKVEDLPVYVIRRENGKGEPRSLHLMLKCDSLPLELSENLSRTPKTADPELDEEIGFRE